MKNILVNANCIVAQSYREHYNTILAYITYRINHKYEAEDLTQDVFMRLLDYKRMLRADTVKYFLFTIARNIVTDYIRRYYKKQEVVSYMSDASVRTTNEPEEAYIVKDLMALEANKLNTFSPRRKTVYSLNRFEDKSISEISEELQLSRRTIENHLLMGRRTMRAFFKQCI